MIKILRGTEAQRITYGGLEVGRMMVCTDSLLTWIGTADGDINVDNTASIIAEIFDDLNTAAINGQGVYGRCAPWVGDEQGTGTAEVTVLAGDDKMLTLTTGAPNAGNFGSARLDINSNSKMARGIIKFKFRTSDVTVSVDIKWEENGTVRFIVGTWASQFRFRWGTGDWTNFGAIANDTWYTVEIHFDSASQIITTFVDDVWAGYFTLHNDSKFRYIGRLFMRSYDDNVTFDIDELEIVNHGVYPYRI